ncbi:MAG: hypothetical protein ACMG6E_03455, partial [Candidatus Roizmanbacteria bacterium]
MQNEGDQPALDIPTIQENTPEKHVEVIIAKQDSLEAAQTIEPETREAQLAGIQDTIADAERQIKEAKARLDELESMQPVNAVSAHFGRGLSGKRIQKERELENEDMKYARETIARAAEAAKKSQSTPTPD